MTKDISNKDVLLFIPNLIGYTRVLLGIISFVLMVFSPDNWFTAIMLYLTSFILDLFDGMAARKFDQCSEFGGLLDMITDRCATLGLCFVLYGEYGATTNEYFAWFKILFMMLALLDISSHWCQMYSAAALQVHHKSSEGNANKFFLVRYYYQSYPFFGYCCVSAEVTYITMYALAHATVEKDEQLLIDIVKYILYFCIPGCVTKQIVNVFQLSTSCNAVAANDAMQRKNKRT
mmetsp:Transcript_7684/g.8783  ORF Transcript_7684/g.8783 Transcript_7684/m.8783 type:complete len:233 (-) Transcript_7684:238-936(-)